MIWEDKKLGEVLKLEYGKPLPKEDRIINGKYPVYGANGIKDRADKFYYDKKTVIVGRKGSAGEVNLTDERFWPLDVTYFATFDFEKYDLKYVYYLLKSLNLKKLAKGVKPGINRNDIYAINVKFPPIEKQKEISNVLDKFFEKLIQIEKNNETNSKNIDKFVDSYFYNIYEKESIGWEEKKIGEICNLMTGGTPSKAKKKYFENGKINWLVSGDVHMKEIISCEGRITELGLKNSNAKFLPLDSVIIALNGQGKTRGTVAMLRIKATCNQSLVSIFPKDTKEIIPEYIYHNLDSRYLEIRKITGDSGNDRRGLNMRLIRNIMILYPKSIEKQKQFIKRFNEIKNKTDELRTIYENKKSNIEELKKSILHKTLNIGLQEVQYE